MGNYLSPIALKNDKETIDFRQSFKLKGRNVGAIYNTETKNFEVQDRIILKIRSKRYQLVEYHFHTPGEHEVDGKIYDAEVHYVFFQLAEDQECLPENHQCGNICCGDMPAEVDPNLTPLIVARVFKNDEEAKTEDLLNFPVLFPETYFQYDGAFSALDDSFLPVRWIVGDWYLHYNVAQLEPIAKDAAPLQPTNGRIVLYRNKCRKVC